MRTQLLFEAPPMFETDSLESRWEEKYDWGDLETSNRTSRSYIQWVQSALNRILGAGLAVDGIMGSQTRRTIASFQRRAGLTADGIVGTQTEKAFIASGAGSPPSNSSPVTPSSPRTGVPTSLLRSESASYGLTLYVNISLDRESQAKPITGIFIPSSYRAQPQVNLILYLHGHNQHQPVNHYWNRAIHPHFALREEAFASGKNVILVAPSLGPKSQTGALTKPGGFEQFLDRVINALNQYSPHYKQGQSARVGNLILACHSGGGWPMRQLAISHNKYSPNIRECWGFDCTYNRGDDTQWAVWGRSNPAAKLYIYYIPGSPTAPLATSLQAKAGTLGLQNVIVRSAATRSHNHVPIFHFRQQIIATPVLQSR